MRFILPLLGLALLLAGCNNSSSENPDSETPQTGLTEPLFKLLETGESGVDFQNTITEDANRNYFIYLYYYNGGGVSIGDIDNDGLPDIYLTGNMVDNKLYRNLGGMKFEDITYKAGVKGSPKWTTGVTMADVNADGWLDIYVCQSGLYETPDKRRNMLYMNNGNGTFTDKAAELGIDDGSTSTHASFFDYDLDGDLDLYVVNHPIEFGAKMNDKLLRAANPGPYESDHLYRNDGDKFTDVTESAGIRNYGFGLSATVGDLNQDGYPDIYVANDFAEPDFLYVNNGDGTFTDKILEMTYHISQFGMGTDIADINNDGLLDIIELDMMAEDNLRKKTNMQGMQPEAFWFNVGLGYHHQYMQNTLQLNNGNGTFSEIGELASISTTDWSWSPLAADYDNDGDKDLFVTNGYRRDARDNDFMKKIKQMSPQESANSFETTKQLMPVNKMPNYAFRNEGNLRFEKMNKDWGLGFKGFSNGAAYGDLDNDGDLDLVVNNLDDRSLVYENQATQNGNNWLQVKLTGKGKNPHAMGARVLVTTGGITQLQELNLSRGYQSSVDPVLHFGLGSQTSASKIEVFWPDGTNSSMTNANANQRAEFKWENAVNAPEDGKMETDWKDASGESGLNFVQQENEAYDDYDHELLLPHRESRNGPFLAVGRFENGAQEDFFIGGSAGYPGKIFNQVWPGSFKERSIPVLVADRAYEDMGAVIFDADGDGDRDLYVVSGSNEFEKGSEMYQDRLYLREGPNFVKAKSALPEIRTSGSKPVVIDYDQDGDPDLFVGGRLVPGEYPFPAKSLILRNDGGKFTDVTAEVSPDFEALGMVTDAVAMDVDGDEDEDLVIVGEWMDILIYRNDNGKFTNATKDFGLGGYTGWWFSLTPADLDGDGDMDLIAGNIGENTKYKASEAEPFQVYCRDFDGNGSLDIVLGYFNDGKAFPVRGRTCSSQQMPFIKDKFPTYEHFGRATLEEVYGDKLDSALHYSATWMKSSVIWNDGGKFRVEALPVQAQFSAVMGAAWDEVNSQLVLAGNHYDAEVETERHDASVGCVLQWSGGKFVNIPLSESGFFAPGNVKDVVSVRSALFMYVLVARNQGPVSVYARQNNGEVQ